MMKKILSILGFGEAGSSFSEAAGWKNLAKIFDIRDDAQMHQRICDAGNQESASISEALSGTSIVLSLVTADQALSVAEGAAKYITKEALFFDMNSVAPSTKLAGAALIEQAGGRYVDVAVMSPVNPARLNTPLLVSGPHFEAGVDTLREIGFTNVRGLGGDVGRASSVKMLRSVMYKGIEALTAECLIACERAGVTDEVIRSFGGDWEEQANYRLDRIMVHGLRRAAEMREVVKTLENLGVDPLMTRGTVERQHNIGMLKRTPVPDNLKEKLEQIKS